MSVGGPQRQIGEHRECTCGAVPGRPHDSYCPGFLLSTRSERDVLVSIAQLLEEALAVQRHLLARLGSASDSRSSVQIEQNSKGTNLTVKVYDGSPVPGDEALAEFGRIFREKVAQEMNGWAETVMAPRQES